MVFLAVKEGKNTHSRYSWSLAFILVFMNMLRFIFYMGATFSLFLYEASLLDDEFLNKNGPLRLYVDLFFTVFVVLSCDLAVRWICKRNFLPV